MMHYRDMGFVVATAEDAMKLYGKIFNETSAYKRLYLNKNKEQYVIHRFNNVEFWYHFGPKKSHGVEFVACNGNGVDLKYKGIVDPTLKQKKKKKWSGALLVAFEETSAGIPLVVDVVNAHLLLEKYNKIEMDSMVKVELGVFADQFKFFDNEDVVGGLKLAQESFIPIGLVDGSGAGKVLVNGVVEYVELKKNPFSKIEYYELGVKCLSMKFCVLLATTLVDERDIVVGEPVSVIGWMSAKVDL